MTRELLAHIADEMDMQWDYFMPLSEVILDKDTTEAELAKIERSMRREVGDETLWIEFITEAR